MQIIIDKEMKFRPSYIIDMNDMPEGFPTHRHEPEFWESLGRTIATYGFLEEVLAKAVFALSATIHYEQKDIQMAYKKWSANLEKTLSDQLFNLSISYEEAARNHPRTNLEILDHLVRDIKESRKIRNAICHGSWRPPNKKGKSVPFFFNNQGEQFETAIDIEFLRHLQQHISNLACAVINSVTSIGLQFPGSDSPGDAAWDAGSQFS